MTQPWSDTPISTQADDAFGRAAYASRAAHLIAHSNSWDGSIVFGLTGPWGSGKSSMLAMIVEELETSHKDWCVARFTPWATTDVSGLLGEFYSALTSALPGQKGKKVRKSLGTLLELAAPVAGAIPIAGGVAAEIAKKSGQALVKEPPWDSAFQRASDKTRELETPILVIADDIDRLQTEELLALLKVVRLLGRFPGVNYLLAYDDATLFRALSAANVVGNDDEAASRFMEKIVQYPLVVPPLLPTQLLDRLSSGLDEVLRVAERTGDPNPRIQRLLDVFRSVLATPRAIDRYLAQLRHHLPLHPQGETDDDDVIILTLLRTAFPMLYVQLPRWDSELISGHTAELATDRGSAGDGMRYERFDLAHLLSAVPESGREDARRLLIELFPKLDTSGFTSGASPIQRICNADYFSRYFAMGVPSHDIADSKVAAAVGAASGGNPFDLQELVTLTDAARATLVIDKAMTSADAIVVNGDDARRVNLLRALIPIIDAVTDEETALFGPRRRVLSWAGVILRSVSDQADAAAVGRLLKAPPSLGARLRLLNEADKGNARPAWWPYVTAGLAEETTAQFVKNLRAGDSAPRDHTMVIHFFSTMASADAQESLKTELARAIAADEFSIESLAARFVYQQFGDRLLFNQEAYDKLAPSVAGSLYEAPVIDVDETDWSWETLRAYASGRARRPTTGMRSGNTSSLLAGDPDGVGDVLAAITDGDVASRNEPPLGS